MDAGAEGEVSEVPAQDGEPVGIGEPHGIPVRGTEEQDDQPETITFDQMSEEELLAGIEGLVPPEKSDDY